MSMLPGNATHLGAHSGITRKFISSNFFVLSKSLVIVI